MMSFSLEARSRWRLLALVCSALFFGCALAQIVNGQETRIPSGPYRIAGTVVNAKASNALAHCRVTIADSKNRKTTQSLITGDNGRFEFHVQGGKFSLVGEKRGFIGAAYNQHEQFSTAIVTGAGLDTENLVLRLSPNPVLTGKVLDESGEPVRGAQVMVYRHDQSTGVSRTFVYRSATTDDQGRYEVTPLQEGVYFLSARSSPWYAVHPFPNADGAASPPTQVDSSLDVAYPITYYGDATESDDAIPITVHGGDHLEADIHLRPVPALHMILHVPDGGNFPRLFKPVFEGVEEPEGLNMQALSPGVLEINVAPGRYTIRMIDSNGEMREPIEANLNSGGELDIPASRPTSKIRAAVQIEGAASLPAQLSLDLNNRSSRRVRAPVDINGEADFTDVIPGVYNVTAATPTERYSVVRMASEAGVISGHTLTVPSGALVTLALSLVGGSVRVEGFAKRNEEAVAGAMIVLVPRNAEADRDRFRRDESDLDGSFSLANVIPGPYTVIAIEDGWDLDWAEPAVLAQYLKRGQNIEVGDHPADVHMTGAVQVQAK